MSPRCNGGYDQRSASPYVSVLWASILVLIHLLMLLVSADASTPRTLVAKVERVSDGDTVIAITSNQTKLRLRLPGIDAPEVPHGDKPGQPYEVVMAQAFEFEVLLNVLERRGLITKAAVLEEIKRLRARTPEAK